MNCGERAGFLFAHACDRTAAWNCTACGKPICAEHTRMSEAGYTCIGCVKTANAQVQEERDAAGQRTGETTDDPYFYADDDYESTSYYDADDRRAFDSSSSGQDDGMESDFGGS